MEKGGKGQFWSNLKAIMTVMLSVQDPHLLLCWAVERVNACCCHQELSLIGLCRRGEGFFMHVFIY